MLDTLRRHDLDRDVVDALFRLLVRQAHDSTVTARDITQHAGLPIGKALTIIRALATAEFYTVPPYECPACGEELNPLEGNPYCPRCSQTLDPVEALRITVPGTATAQDTQKLVGHAVTKSALTRFADAWRVHGCVYYVILDLVRSQALQRELGDAEYTSFLVDARDALMMRALSQAKDVTVSFGEVGDMHKLGFATLRDAFHALCEFSRFLYRHRETNPAVQHGETQLPFPCYTASLVQLDLPQATGCISNPDSVLSVTLSGVADINSALLTEYYRLEAAIKTKDTVFDDTEIALWVFDPIDPTVYGAPPQLARAEISGGKHSAHKTGTAVLAHLHNGQVTQWNPHPECARNKR